MSEDGEGWGRDGRRKSGVGKSLPQNHSTMDEEYEECERKNVH